MKENEQKEGKLATPGIEQKPEETPEDENAFAKMPKEKRMTALIWTIVVLAIIMSICGALGGFDILKEMFGDIFPHVIIID